MRYSTLMDIVNNLYLYKQIKINSSRPFSLFANCFYFIYSIAIDEL